MPVHPVVPLNDLSRALVNERAAIDRAVGRVLDSGWLVLGQEVAELERELGAYLGVAHVVSVASGTDALVIGLLALGCGPGDLVATVANAGAYATTAISQIGAVPVYVDVDPRTALMTSATLAPALERGVTAVVATHLFGQMVDMPDILRACQERGIALLEDCAQSIGARQDGRRAGSWGDAAAFSFYPTKNLAALGDGGMITTNSEQTAQTALSLRQYGWSSKYHIDRPGGRNSRLDEIQAAVLRTRLPLLEQQNCRRREIFARYADVVGTEMMFGSSEDTFVAHLAVLRVGDRDRAREVLSSRGVSTDVHYPVPDHRQDGVTVFEIASHLSVTEQLAKDIVTVPCFPELTEAEVDAVCAALGTT